MTITGLLAISTSDPDPLGALSILWDQTCKDKLYAPRHHPPVGLSPSIRTRPDEDNHKIEWANPELVRYIVLIHDFGAGTGREGWEELSRPYITLLISQWVIADPRSCTSAPRNSLKRYKKRTVITPLSSHSTQPLLMLLDLNHERKGYHPSGLLRQDHQPKPTMD